MDSRAQTALEYILIAAAVLLFLVIAVVILRSQVFSSANNSITNSVAGYDNILNQFASTTTTTS